MCILFATHSPPSPHPAPDFAARLLAGVQYARMCVYVSVCVRAVVAALPQRYFENCILRFSRGFACFDRVAADFDLMTFQHTLTHTLTHTHMKTYTHVQRARHYQQQRQSNSKHHSLTHSFIRSSAHAVSESLPATCPPPSTSRSRW